MRCPKCGYCSFDYLDACPKCGMAWSEYKTQLNIKGIKPQSPNFLTDLLATKEKKAEEASLSEELEKAAKSVQEIEIKEKTDQEKEVLYPTEEIETPELAKEPEAEVNEEISELETVGETLLHSEKPEKPVEPAQELEAKEEITEIEETLPPFEETIEEFPEEKEIPKEAFSPLEEIEKASELLQEPEGVEELPKEEEIAQEEHPSPEEIQKITELAQEPQVEKLSKEKVAEPEEDLSLYPEAKSVFEEIEGTLVEIEKMDRTSEMPEINEEKSTSPETIPEAIEVLEEVEKTPLELDISESDIEVLEDIEPPKK